ncbi:MAG: response regulator transcription factor [Bacteroidetes bacterium]|nr:response regulator transcription factor [Bacteroidota bacterium]
MKKILLIDDDTKLTDLLKDYFIKYSFEPVSFENPVDALSELSRNRYDFVILDIMLPEMDGFETLKEIRKTTEIPVIMLTARGETTDRIVGLELGADDYLSKPFEPRELLARIQSVFRRTDGKRNVSPVFNFKDLIIDTASRKVRLNKKPLELTSMEFDILVLFAENNGKVLSRDFLMQKVKGTSWNYNDRSIDVMVSRLRGKLHVKNLKFIKTVQSVGYIFYAGYEEN